MGLGLGLWLGLRGLGLLLGLGCLRLLALMDAVALLIAADPIVPLAHGAVGDTLEVAARAIIAVRIGKEHRQQHKTRQHRRTPLLSNLINIL